MHTSAAVAPMASQSLPKVRVAVKDDFPQILGLCRMLHAENGLTGWAEERIVSALHRAIAGDGSVIGVIGTAGSLEAMIHLFISRMWYSNDPHLEELYAYVHKDHRRSNNAKSLIEFAKSTAERLNVPLLIGIVSNHRTEQKIRLYQRRLGKPSGCYFLYNATTGRE
jgi:GNAT superfamily N-acetyltransferase